MSGATGLRPLAERFWEKVSKADGDACWQWIGYRMPKGYGQIRKDRQPDLAHRVAWELTRGPIPAGLFVCHRCDNPPCVTGCAFRGPQLGHFKSASRHRVEGIMNFLDRQIDPPEDTDPDASVCPDCGVYFDALEADEEGRCPRCQTGIGVGGSSGCAAGECEP